jgi:hypothetical protein
MAVIPSLAQQRLIGCSFSETLLQLHQDLIQLLDEREKIQGQLQKTYGA